MSPLGAVSLADPMPVPWATARSAGRGARGWLFLEPRAREGGARARDMYPCGDTEIFQAPGAKGPIVFAGSHEAPFRTTRRTTIA